MTKFSWILTIIGGVIAVLSFLMTLFSSESAPQQAAGAGISLCFVVIPYCVARAITEMSKK